MAIAGRGARRKRMIGLFVAHGGARILSRPAAAGGPYHRGILDLPPFARLFKIRFAQSVDKVGTFALGWHLALHKCKNFWQLASARLLLLELRPFFPSGSPVPEVCKRIL
jgi:hypothetical protein